MNPYDLINSELASATTLAESSLALESLLSGGFSVWEDGSLYNIKQLVERVHGLEIHVLSREHSPPHFHVSNGDIDATFSLLDCTLLKGRVSRREKALVDYWYKKSRPLLVKTWNETRPTDCPVGPFTE